MAAKVSQILELLVEQHIVSAETLRKWDSSSIKATDDISHCLDQLVQHRLLTSFQAELIGRGDSGSLVLGNYILLDKIGAGGMGEVYKARHSRMDRIVAVKLMQPHSATMSGALERFQREVRAVARLDHPNIVTAYDADEAGNVPFLVMQFVDGPDLASIVRRHGPLAVGQVVDIAIQTARGLEYAHAHGVVHRDIKPSNLLIDSRGIIKILDMGLARLSGADQSESGLTNAGQIMGTMDFMAPEQAEDSHQADARSDIYSLGCTIYWLLTSKPVYTGTTSTQKFLGHREAPIPALRSVRPEVLDQLDNVYQRMVAKRPADRFQTASEIITVLESLGIAVPCDATETFHALPGPKSGRSSTERQSDATNTLSESQRTKSQVELASRKRVAVWVGIPLLIFIAIALSPLIRKHTSSTEGHSTKGANAVSPNEVAASQESRNRTPPPIAFSPFNKKQADDLRNRWANYLGIPAQRQNSIDMRLALIPPGVFLMGASQSEGSADDDELPLHRVEISDAYYLAENEVTIAQFRRFVEATDYVTKFENNGGGFVRVNGEWTKRKELSWKTPGYAVNDQMPVTQLAYEDAEVFCRWLSGVEKEDYRLPTEAEWEFACRAGTETQWSFGDLPQELSKYAVVDEREPNPAPVRSRLPNPFGLYDMHGNVWEFCFDIYLRNFYLAESRLDPQGALNGDLHSVRGGTWRDSSDMSRSASRSSFRNGSDSAGFRVALSVSSLRNSTASKLRQGIQHYRNQEYATAIGLLTDVLSRRPDHIDALSHRGSSYFFSGASERAVLDFSDLIRLAPNFSGAYSWRGDAYYAMRSYSRAEADYSIVIQRYAYVGTFLKRSHCYMYMGNNAKSLADLNTYLDFVSNDADALSQRAYIHRQLEHWDECIQDASKSIALNPKICINYGNRSFAYIQVEKLDEALSDAEMRIKLLPESHYGYFLKGMILVKKNQGQQAIVSLDQAIRLQPSSSSYLWRAKAFEAIGAPEKAAADRAKMKELDSNSEIVAEQ